MQPLTPAPSSLVALRSHLLAGDVGGDLLQGVDDFLLLLVKVTLRPRLEPLDLPDVASVLLACKKYDVGVSPISEYSIHYPLTNKHLIVLRAIQ